MNKYLKVLMLSGGLMGAIAPSAINWDKTYNYDLGYIYNHVERMQKAVPNLTRIDCKLNIGLENTPATADENNANPNNIIEQDDTINDSSNITFTITDEHGNQTELDNKQTLNYLNETLNQTNMEYENLKQVLVVAINDTMNYLENYRNNPQELTNEQKLYIKEHANSIKYLAETLENLSEEVICTIDCKDCGDCDDINETAGIYITTIQNLENRIQTLLNAINSLQLISTMGSGLFNSPTFIPRYALYHITKDIKDEDIIQSNETDNTDESIESDSLNSENTTENKDSYATDTNLNIADNSTNDNNSNNKPTTFNLKSNIDTYAPTKRNIDTFFNTALLDDQYMYNGGGYGYGMPYNGYGMYGGGLGNPYGGYNSNMVNREYLNKQVVNQTNNSNIPTSANIDSTNTPDKIEQLKKLPTKKSKNVDTYTLSTIKSNINTMGESKISKFVKDKLKNLKNKVKNKKDDIKNHQEDNEQTLNTIKDTTKRAEDTINDLDIQKEANTEANIKTLDLDAIQSNINVELTENILNELSNTPTLPQFKPDIKTR